MINQQYFGLKKIREKCFEHSMIKPASFAVLKKARCIVEFTLMHFREILPGRKEPGCIPGSKQSCSEQSMRSTFVPEKMGGDHFQGNVQVGDPMRLLSDSATLGISKFLTLIFSKHSDYHY